VSGWNDPSPITSFTGEHAFLSNFAPSPIRHGEHTYPTAEHLYQARKCWVPADAAAIRLKATPAQAKQFGRRVQIVANWEQAKRPTMLRIVLAKFEQNPDLAKQLDATWGRKLVEGNTWNDTCWGAVEYDGREDRWSTLLPIWHTADPHVILAGHNWLGRILMFVREVLHEGGTGA
jgi:ribA/ribD-fused uncharacterized protein